MTLKDPKFDELLKLDKLSEEACKLTLLPKVSVEQTLWGFAIRHVTVVTHLCNAFHRLDRLCVVAWLLSAKVVTHLCSALLRLDPPCVVAWLLSAIWRPKLGQSMWVDSEDCGESLTL